MKTPVVDVSSYQQVAPVTLPKTLPVSGYGAAPLLDQPVLTPPVPILTEAGTNFSFFLFRLTDFSLVE